MIAEFFEDREIFLTGGSGVVGKALIEKLLRSCNVRKIYILLRPKRNCTLEERLEKIKHSMIFRRLLKEKPNEFDEKIAIIPGDAELPLLGITPEHAQLMENISVVIHSAATVSFDETLKKAIKMNVGGTLETLKFAETRKHLEVFLHVSTFFSNPYLYKVESKMYDAPMDWKFCLDLSRRNDISDEMIDTLTKKLIVGFPNTYCFTKNLAESLVNDYRHKLPVAICRPSIVVFSISEPEPGFSPSLFGAMGLFAIAGAGILKCLHMAPKQRLDLLPQDISVKSMLYYIVKTAKICSEKNRSGDINVYNISSCTHTNITFKSYIKIMEKQGFWIDFALEKSFLIPGLKCTDNIFVYKFYVILQQLIPAALIDMILVLNGRKPELLKVQRKIFHTLNVMKPFLFNNYESNGVTDVEDMLKELTGTEFNLDELKYSNKFYTNVGYCYDMVSKIREVLFKEDASTIPRSRRILQAKIVAYRCMQIFFAYKMYQWYLLPKLYEWEFL